MAASKRVLAPKAGQTYLALYPRTVSECGIISAGWSVIRVNKVETKRGFLGGPRTYLDIYNPLTKHEARILLDQGTFLYETVTDAFECGHSDIADAKVI